MLQVAHHPATGELLVDGRRGDYRTLESTVQRVVASGIQEELEIESTGPELMKCILIKRLPSLNRVNIENGCVVISIDPTWMKNFLSYIRFPEEKDLPKSPVRYHHHYDYYEGIPDTAPGSQPVIFSLMKEY